MKAHERIIFPLDVSNDAEAWNWCITLQDSVGIMKVGLELFTRLGPQAVYGAQAKGFDVMLDLKLHDIPNTVGQAALQAAEQHNARFITVHASGGTKMVEAAVKTAGPNTILAVTALTSLDNNDLMSIYKRETSEDAVKALAEIAYVAGARGFVCSPQEVAALRKEFGKDVTLVVPGVRPAGSSLDDQKRVATPAEAIKNGADYLVIGRPIRKADDPKAAAEAIANEISEALQ